MPSAGEDGGPRHLAGSVVHAPVMPKESCGAPKGSTLLARPVLSQSFTLNDVRGSGVSCSRATAGFKAAAPMPWEVLHAQAPESCKQ